jgi:hypothetical protein
MGSLIACSYLNDHLFQPFIDLGGCRKLHNEVLHSLYSSPNIIRVIKSRRMGLVGHVTRMAWFGIHIYTHFSIYSKTTIIALIDHIL